MGVTATSGCSMTSVSRMLLRRDMGRCSEGTTTRAVKEADHSLVSSKAATLGFSNSPEEVIFEHAEYNYFHHENFSTIFCSLGDVKLREIEKSV